DSQGRPGAARSRGRRECGLRDARSSGSEGARGLAARRRHPGARRTRQAPFRRHRRRHPRARGRARRLAQHLARPRRPAERTRMTHHPPLRAQWLVSALAPARSHDSVVGDLLEEYRESQVPERGVGAADRWFVRQALGFLWTASAPAAWAMAGNLSARTLLDMSIPSGDLSSRAWITTVIAMGIFAWHG